MERLVAQEPWAMTSWMIRWDDRGAATKIEVVRIIGGLVVPVKTYKGDPVKVLKKISEEIEGKKEWKSGWEDP